MGLLTANRTQLLMGVMMLMIFTGCSGSKPDTIGVSDNRLAACPDSPNCVSSDAQDEKQRVLPFFLVSNTAEKWAEVIDVIGTLPRTTLITQTDRYLHAECKSRIFRFVDDLELLMNPESGEISIRSASRVGYSDMGVNRKRVESLRQILLEKGIARE